MGKGKGHIPIRTCISCGAKRSKSELIRLVLNAENQLVRDDQGRWQGRGAYVCKSKSCREQLSKNRRLGRSLKSRKTITISPALWAK
ncbi:MAG: YlxR family protein [Deltaproteobacteria bacterium]|jgi:predicted RNA-binding protein YlxR (DUF448 family)|nr:MAG: YlxR family protein [Deltaproteobacteria bacterium]